LTTGKSLLLNQTDMKEKITLGVVVAFFLFFLKNLSSPVLAISEAKDTISTSRPSSYTTLGVGVSLSDTQAIVVDNGSRWIASDSATIIGAATFSATVASMSAANTPTTSKRTVYFATAATGIGHSGSVIYTPITAKHTVSFRNSVSIPDTGKIQIIFPVGVGNTGALPADDSFSFNGLAQNNISLSGGGAVCGSWAVTESTKTIQCNLSTGLTGPATIIINIGSANPTLINPSKSAAAGTADLWTIKIKTLDATSATIEETKVRVGTVDSVEVYATVDPTLSFTIAGMTNGAAMNVGNSGCSNTETVNTGFNSTATEVNLGVLNSSMINRSGQLLTVTTNATSGYSLTATSSGHLVDNAIGYWIADAQGTPTNNDTPDPDFLTAGTPAFGIHPCGLDITSVGLWGTGPTGGGADAKYANPSSIYYYTLASDTNGPITGPLGNGITTVKYAATVSTAVPAGNFHTAMTYVATPSF